MCILCSALLNQPYRKVMFKTINYFFVENNVPVKIDQSGIVSNRTMEDIGLELEDFSN